MSPELILIGAVVALVLVYALWPAKPDKPVDFPADSIKPWDKQK